MDNYRISLTGQGLSDAAHVQIRGEGQILKFRKTADTSIEFGIVSLPPPGEVFAVAGPTAFMIPAHSGLVKQRYAALGVTMQLVVPPGQGHNMWQGFSQCHGLVNFVIAPAKP
jgi:hypothetical protein